MENRDRDCLTETARKDSGRRTFLKIAGGAVAAATGLAGILDFGRAPAWVKAKKFPGEALAQGTTEPAVVGAWSGTVDLPIVAIHMHLLPDGSVLAWGKPETPPDPSFGVEAAVWDPTLTPPTFYGAHDPYVTIYCSGHSFLADGRLLAAGGHMNDFVGSKVVSIFDFSSRTWSRGADMLGARWYPTNTTLENGDVLVVSGSITESQVNTIPEVWNAAAGWRSLTGAALSLPLYPWMHLAPNGMAFYSGPEGTTRYLDTTGTGRWTTVGLTNFGDRHQYEGTSVMYEPGKILIVGGGNPATASAEVINLNDASPQWRSTNSMTFRRRYLNATILPDGKVLVTGGSSSGAFSDPSGAIYNAEMWDPATESWSTMAAMSTSRLYHSTALLLPDGRILLAGGGGDGAGGDIDHYNAQYYSPPYLFKGVRPSITSISSAQATVGYGETFLVGTSDTADITKVTLVRLSSVTHEFNQNQRFNQLAFSTTSDGTGLSVTAPSDPKICPPGHYMLFILNSAGVPSVAKITRIGALGVPADTTPPVISSVAASNISTSAATITWTTNETSDSQVEYGPTIAYGRETTLDSALVTSHRVGLSGLTAGTLYHYRVKSRDAASNLAVSGDFTFTTPAPLSIAADGFESGTFSGGTGWSGPWTKSGDVSIRTNVDGPIEGKSHVRLRRNTGYLQRTLNLSGAQNVRLTFWAKVRSFEGSDKALVKVSPDGVTFTTVKVFTSADSNNTYRYYDLDLAGFAMTANFSIAFDAEMSSTGDNWFIDNIQITGARPSP
ncbi:MAG: hypothetical protein DMD89_33675 [Candidatus Rokuibacteriota bacterium]|nr:MAG: hypothetical protein DMD89_33675 [Candidatus Rokubacteria bacterium]